MTTHVILKKLKQLVKKPINKREQRLIKKSAASNAHFAIDSTLLGDPNNLAWSNLGFWQVHTTKRSNDYINACQHLAYIVGDAAQLSSTDKLLDLGCGQGASLQYWCEAFAVKHITAFELQTACIEKIKQAALPQLDAIYQASFSQLPLPAAQLKNTFDAVVCVDAAYHASLSDFLAVNQAALKPDGRMAFTTLIRPTHFVQTGRVGQLVKHCFLKLVCIPQQPSNTEIKVRELLGSFNFTDIQIEHLDNGVLNGFAQYIKQQPPHLSTDNAAAWLKITLTAKLCAFLYQHKLVHYSVVSARYTPS